MRKIEISNEFLEILKKYNSTNKEDRESVSKLILQELDIKTTDNVNINDIVDFINAFGGFDKNIYMKYKSLKEESELSWEDIKNLKYEDIHFDDNTLELIIKQ